MKGLTPSRMEPPVCHCGAQPGETHEEGCARLHWEMGRLYARFEAEQSAKSEPKPRFPSDVVVSTASLVSDVNGDPWWIDPHEKICRRV